MSPAVFVANGGQSVRVGSESDGSCRIRSKSEGFWSDQQRIGRFLTVSDPFGCFNKFKVSFFVTVFYIMFKTNH